jgi:hypothetical protein
MEVSNSSRRIEKFNERPGTISLREFKTTFSTMVYELELKYGVNYTEAFAFKQLVRYVHYEALMSTSNILRGFWASPKSPIQFMPQPSPPPFKLDSKLTLHIMGLCPIIQI